MKFIWYNPDSNVYEMGPGAVYKDLKVSSANPQGFTLLYKMNAASSKIGQKLISELNRARVESRTGAYSVHAA